MTQQTEDTGYRFSFATASVTFAIPGAFYDLPQGALQDFNWSWTQDDGDVEGNQIAPVGRTPGSAKATGDISILVSEADAVISFLTQNGTIPLGSAFFSLHVGYSVNDIDTRTTDLRGALIKGGESTNAVGSTATMKKFTLSMMGIKENGIEQFGDPTT